MTTEIHVSIPLDVASHVFELALLTEDRTGAEQAALEYFGESLDQAVRS